MSEGKLHGSRAGGGCTVRTCCTACLVFVCVVGVWAVMSAIERVKSVAKDPTFHFLQRLGSGNREGLEKFLVNHRGHFIDLVGSLQSRVIFQPDGVGFVIDLSRDGEGAYLYRRHLQRRFKEDGKTPRYTPTIVDIGANDGFLSSNSYPLVQLGWSTVLVEPNPDMMKLAKQSQSPFINPYLDRPQTACYVLAGMSGNGKKSKMPLMLSKDSVTMESSLRGDASHAHFMNSGKGSEIMVDVLPVDDVAQRCKLPKRFGILSVDAEGVGDKVLHAWIDGGYKPEIIVYESMHNIESFEDTKSYLEKHEYRFLKTLGFNHMFEFVEPALV